MAGVIPAWKLVELLNDPDVLTTREEAAAMHLQGQDHLGEAVLDIEADEPREREFEQFKQFEGLMQKLVRVPNSEIDKREDSN
jgi:hypothetical protein